MADANNNEIVVQENSENAESQEIVVTNAEAGEANDNSAYNNPAPCVYTSEPVIISQPSDGSPDSVIVVEPGKTYIFDFAVGAIAATSQKDGDIVIKFANDTTITLKDFDAAFTAQFPPALTLADGTVVSAHDLVDTLTANNEKVEEEKTEEPQSDVRKAAQIEPAAGDEPSAEELAQIETAAGEEGGAKNSGFGFQSSFAAGPIDPLTDVGPINPTALQYGVDFNNDFVFPEEEVPDDSPILTGPLTESMDETNLGPLVETGQVLANFGNDGPGTIKPSNSFVAGGSLLGGNLTSNGVAVVVTQTADGYVGKAGGVDVFTLVIDPATGNYTFTLLDTLDHQDAGNPNDIITLQFGVVATDKDGDKAQTTITINVADDAPLAVAPKEETVDEADLGPVSISDTLDIDFGNDLPGTVNPNGSTNVTGDVAGGNLTSNGAPVVITQTATGYVGKAAGVDVFTLNINPNTGAYTFTLIKPLDHSNPGDKITIDFGVVVKDFDQDAVSTTITINIVDSVPCFGTPGIGAGVENIDETNLGPINVGGTMNFNFGSDTPGKIETNGVFTKSGSLLGGNLTSDGVAVVVTQTPGGYVGMAGGVKVFELTINQNTGAYNFKLLEQLDHNDPNNPNDVITLKFGVTVTDKDGDTDTSTITINVADDAVTANDDFNTYNVADGGDSGNVITGLNGGAGAADVLSEDVDNTVVKVSFNGTTVNIPEGGFSTINGQYGTLKMFSNGSYTYTLFSGSPTGSPEFLQDKFTYVLKDGDGDTDPAYLTLKGSFPPVNACIDVNNGIDNVQVKEDGSVTVPVTASYTGGNGNEHLTLTLNGVNPTWGFLGAGWVATGVAGQYQLVLADGQRNFSGTFKFTPPAQSDVDLNALSVTATVSGPNPGDSDSASDGFNIIVDAVADKPSITANDGTGEEGQPIAINIAGLLGVDNFDGSEVISGYQISGLPTTGFTFNKGTNLGGGVWSFTPAQISGLTLTPTNPDFFGTLNLTAKILTTENPVSDGEFDTTDNNNSATDAFCLIWKPDGNPVLVQPETVSVDETNLSPTTQVSGTIEADFGNDGPGTFSGTGSFSSAIALTSNGAPVVVNFNAATNTYTGTSGGNTIFTLAIEADGDYTFTLRGVLDHPNATNPNDNIPVQFGIRATDNDGESTNGTITVNILDDAPKAQADCNRFDLQAVNKDFNILLVLDTSGSMQGTKLALLKSSVANLLGDFNAYNGGVVKVHIVPFSTTAGAGQTFTVTSDADFAAALSYINGFTANGYTNYESALKSGINWLSGSNTIPGAETITYFVSDGEPNRYLDNNGNVVNNNDAAISQAQYTGVADGTNEVAQIQALSDQVIGVGIGVTSTTLARLDIIDSNGDALDVKDPADLDAALQGTNPLNGSASGNVITGQNGGAGAQDDLSNDAPTLVTKVSFGATTVDVPGVGVATINGTYGKLEISANGAYKYTLFTLPDGQIQETKDVFKYTIRDDDGDTSTSELALVGSADQSVIASAAGAQHLYGTSSADTFVFDALTDRLDTIHDFDANGGDVLDVSALLTQYDPLQDSLNDFIFKTESAGNTTISVDVNGTGNIANATSIAVIQGVTGLNLELVTNDGQAAVV